MRSAPARSARCCARRATIVVGGIAFFLILDELGVNLAPFIASAGVIGVALGFGAQSLVKDFLTGLFMLLEDQYGVGDVVDVGPANGTVEAVTLRITKIRDSDGTLWYVPNGTMLRVGNKTQGWATAVVEIDVDYFADLDQVRALLAEAASRVVKDPVVGAHVLGEPTITGIERLSADAVTLRLKVKTSPAMQWEVARELRTATRDALERADVPLAGQRDLMATHRAAIAPQDDDHSAGPAEHPARRRREQPRRPGRGDGRRAGADGGARPGRGALTGLLAGRTVEDRRHVLDELDPPVERPAVHHLQPDVGVAVVDPLGPVLPGDHREHDDAEPVDQARLEQRPAQREAADRAQPGQVVVGLHRPDRLDGIAAGRGGCSPRSAAR